MLGSSFIKGRNTLKVKREKRFNINKLWDVETAFFHKTNQGEVKGSFPEGYPVKVISIGNSKIIFEGLIYNLSESVIEQKLGEIIERALRNENYWDLIQKFQREADGEFFFIIGLDNDFNRSIFFNDFFGRLNVFLYCNDELCIVTRDFQEIFQYINSIKFDKLTLADLIQFGYPLSSRSILEEVSYLDSGEIYEFNNDTFKLNFVCKQIIDLNFKPKYKTRKEFINSIKKELINATEDRVKTIEAYNREIICDLSGGFDSRTVFGCLTLFDLQVGYLTNNILKDESLIAKSLYDLVKPSGYFQILNTEDLRPLPEFSQSELVYLTDCTSGAESTSICVNALKAVSKLHKNAFRFGGIGFTDFIRKGYRNDDNDLLDSIVKGEFNGISLKTTCEISGCNFNEYYSYLKSIFDSWPEKTPEEQHKKLFFRRTLIMQSRLPDDRERLDVWTIHPMWKHQICLEVLKHFPLKWRGYYVHTLLLKAINPLLIQIPVDKSYINFDKLNKMYLMDLKDNSFIYKLLRDKAKAVFFRSKSKNLKQEVITFKVLNKFLNSNNESISLDYEFLKTLDNYLSILQKPVY